MQGPGTRLVLADPVPQQRPAACAVIGQRLVRDGRSWAWPDVGRVASDWVRVVPALSSLGEGGVCEVAHARGDMPMLCGVEVEWVSLDIVPALRRSVDQDNVDDFARVGNPLCGSKRRAELSE